jgi:hypothetical protein
MEKPADKQPLASASPQPIRVVGVDFETAYSREYSVRSLGVHRYVADPRFDAYLVALWSPGFQWVGHPADAPWGEIDGSVWVSHNRQFDEAVFERLQQLGVIHPDSGPLEWHDTAALAAYLQAPRNLAGAARELLGMEIEKTVRDQMEGVVV